ncbi:MAG: ATP synthase subunit C [Synergistaceae bacterium]|jgi:V/A-type H+-transporting ATPase subunit K|nr:ATP synthase subunit C [Synergistaceae bacterium]
MHRSGFRGSRRAFACLAALSFCVLFTGAALSLASGTAVAAEAEPAAAADVSNNGLGFIGMALVTGLACIGAGIAVGSVGSAALGLVGEQPGAIGTTLIYVGLAEGIAIYGIVISILILNKLG